MPDKAIEQALSIELAKRKMSQEMPEEASKTKIQPMGMVSKLTFPWADAVTSPYSNTIRYHPDALDPAYQNQDKLENLLAHELTHVRQNNRTPFLRRMYEIYWQNQGPYHQRSDELEAFQTEKDRILRTHQPGNQFIPGFTDGKPAAHGDITLPTKQARKR